MFLLNDAMRQHNYYVYMMSSLSRTLYAGVTNDLERRVFEHQEGLPGSFTARYHINRLVYCEHFGDIDQAIAREKEIKRLPRRPKLKLIESSNPHWYDLAQQSESSPSEPGIPQRGSHARGNDRGVYPFANYAM
jgi:putative endonuclease